MAVSLPLLQTATPPTAALGYVAQIWLQFHLKFNGNAEPPADRTNEMTVY